MSCPFLIKTNYRFGSEHGNNHKWASHLQNIEEKGNRNNQAIKQLYVNKHGEVGQSLYDVLGPKKNLWKFTKTIYKYFLCSNHHVSYEQVLQNPQRKHPATFQTPPQKGV